MVKHKSINWLINQSEYGYCYNLIDKKNDGGGRRIFYINCKMLQVSCCKFCIYTHPVIQNLQHDTSVN